MLRNELFHGVRVWNRTAKMRNPETGRKVSKPRPAEEWRRVEVPKSRIVPEDLWTAVQGRIAQLNSKPGAARLGGMNRTLSSRSYLFSGLLICAECESRLVIISGRGKRGYVRYGCPSHRYRGVCNNAVTIRQDRLEEQLLAALEERLANPRMIEHIIVRFQEELQKRVALLRRKTSRMEELSRERALLKGKAQRLADAVAEAGHSSALLSTLAKLEAQILEVDRQMEA
jgi:site-specific DNA recombinase